MKNFSEGSQIAAMKFAEGEVVYAFFHENLVLARILSGRTVANTYGPCSHRYTVKITAPQKETIEVELDDLAVFRHATYVDLEKMRNLLRQQVDGKSIDAVDKTYNRIQLHCKAQKIPVPKEIRILMSEAKSA